MIEYALLYPDSTCTLLSYRDIYKNGFHVKTYEDNKEEFLLLIELTGYGWKDQDAQEGVNWANSKFLQ